MFAINQIISLLGDFGLFQKLIVAAFSFMSPPQVFQILFMLFGGQDPPWRCSDSSSVCKLNGTLPSFHPARCRMERSDWEFVVPNDFSIATEFELQCDRAWMRHLMNSMLFLGWGVGAICLGWLADNHGRRMVIYLSQVMVITIGFLMAFCKSVTLIIMFRFLIGVFIPAGVVQTMILISEYVGAKKRPIASLLLFVAFAFGACLFAVKAYFIRQWRLLLIVCTAPYIVTAFSYSFVPESLRWIRLKGQQRDLIRVIQRIASWNKKVLPSNLRVEPPIVSAEESHSVLDIFKTRKLAVRSLSLGYTWFANAMVYFSIIFAAHDLGANPYLNLFLLMIINVPSNGVAMFACNRIGRKKTVIITMTLASLLCGAIGFLPKSGGGGYARLTFALLGDFLISISFGGIYVWSIEVYPTTIRASAMGFLQITSRLGAATAPWIAVALLQVHRAAPYAVMSAATLLAPIPLLLVPETMGKLMADTEEEEDDDNSSISECEMPIIIEKNEVYKETVYNYKRKDTLA